MKERGDIQTLAEQIYEQRQAGEDLYTVFLGSDVLLSPQRQTWEQLVTRTLRKYGEYRVYHSKEEHLSQFYSVIEHLEQEERYHWLYSCLQRVRPSQGHHYLAALVDRGYFNVVLSTNVDTCLEKTLGEIGASTTHYSVLNVDTELPDFYFEDDRSVVIIKLYGDIGTTRFKLSPSETCWWSDRLRGVSRDALQKRVLMVGYDQRRDSDLFHIFPHTEGNPVWYVDDEEPPRADPLAVVAEKRTLFYVSGQDASFDVLFKDLYQHILKLEGLPQPALPPVSPLFESLLDRARYEISVGDWLTISRTFQEILEQSPLGSVRRLLSRLEPKKIGELAALPSTAAPETEEEAIHAMVGIKDHQAGEPLILGEQYILRTGVFYEAPPELRQMPISLDGAEVLAIEVLVTVRDMEVLPECVQTLHFIRGRDSGLLEFFIRPGRLGKTELQIEFYYKQNWLQMLEIPAEVIEAGVPGIKQ
jgi:hypothetical protein